MIPVIFNNEKRLNFKKRVQKKFKDHDFMHKALFLNHLDRLTMILQDLPNITFIDVPDYFLDLPEAKLFFKNKKTVNITSISRVDETLPPNIKHQNAIIALLTCHTINDLVGYFIQIKHALSSDGIFIATFIGSKAHTLVKKAFLEAEIEVTNACDNRFFPIIDIRDLGHLLQRAGFTLPVSDSENYHIRYKNLNRMIMDMRYTGNNNCLTHISKPLTKKVYLKALHKLEEAIPDSVLELDFIIVTGRCPSQKQQKPLKPGSAQMSLSNILK